MSTTGDWYCRNCGYLSASRVTHAETCDTCHQPVEWHDAEQQTALAAAQAEARELRRRWENQRESLSLIVPERDQYCREARELREKLGRVREALEEESGQ